jgi:hypothetical protein
MLRCGQGLRSTLAPGLGVATLLLEAARQVGRRPNEVHPAAADLPGGGCKLLSECCDLIRLPLDGADDETELLEHTVEAEFEQAEFVYVAAIESSQHIAALGFEDGITSASNPSDQPRWDRNDLKTDNGEEQC